MLINDIKVGDHVNCVKGAPGTVINIDEYDRATVKFDVPITKYTIHKSALWKLDDKDEKKDE